MHFPKGFLRKYFIFFNVYRLIASEGVCFSVFVCFWNTKILSNVKKSSKVFKTIAFFVERKKKDFEMYFFYDGLKVTKIQLSEMKNCFDEI